MNNYLKINFAKISFLKIVFISSLFISYCSYADNNLTTYIEQTEANIIFVRHALAPGYGDPQNFQLNDCNTQRNLDEVGRKQATLLGKYFLKNKIKFNEILTSEWCRCIETAERLKLGKWKTFSGLNSYFQGFSKKNVVLKKLRNKLNTMDKKSLTLMITHQVVIAEITGIYTNSGGVVLYNTYNKTTKEILLN